MILNPVLHHIAEPAYQQTTNWTVINQGSIPGKKINLSPLHADHTETNPASFILYPGENSDMVQNSCILLVSSLSMFQTYLHPSTHLYGMVLN
jgi:hypothetical protein